MNGESRIVSPPGQVVNASDQWFKANSLNHILKKE
jgi:hypothetical protein